MSDTERLQLRLPSAAPPTSPQLPSAVRWGPRYWLSVDPLSRMTLIWECEPNAYCITEHHQGQTVDHYYLLRCPVASPCRCSPRNWEHVSQILPGENYDFYSLTVYLIIISLVSSSMSNTQKLSAPRNFSNGNARDDSSCKDLPEYYACGGVRGMLWHNDGRRTMKLNYVKVLDDCWLLQLLTIVRIYFGLPFLRLRVWESAKWVTRVEEYSIYNRNHLVVLNLTTDFVEGKQIFAKQGISTRKSFSIQDNGFLMTIREMAIEMAIGKVKVGS
ncbi:prolyl oligopeptidase family protein [Striga asiatica]|uniref:Prolyl oligopeptidase family protein n=1 Tax=Striga asiatica TaxID=4170 RepID=A0A5A7PDR5_STRAF|nr:prolyl oligopeptidase family protein [Striga asiatica]